MEACHSSICVSTHELTFVPPSRLFAQAFELVKMAESSEGEEEEIEEDDGIGPTRSDDEFSWVWSAMSECPVHINLICVQV